MNEQEPNSLTLKNVSEQLDKLPGKDARVYCVTPFGDRLLIKEIKIGRDGNIEFILGKD